MSSAFGQALHRLRSERGLSLRQLARLVPCSGGYIAQLEAGQRRPSPQFAAVLDRVLGAAGDLAALPADDTPAAIPRLPDWADDRVAAGVSGAARPDEAMRDYLARTLTLQRTAEDTAGARLVLTPVLGQFTTVETLRAEASGKLHHELLSLESQYAQFLGWLYQDLGDRGASEQWYARALMLAHEAGDDNMIASILSMRSNAAWGAGDVRRAVDLGEAACRPHAATPGVLALSHQQAARGYAATGDRTAALKAIDQAVTLSTRAAADPEREPPWVYFQSPDRLEIQRAIALRELGDHQQAADIFRRAIDSLSAEYRRDRGAYLARLALALAQAGERDEAVARANEARAIAVETGSSRTLAEVERVDRLTTASRTDRSKGAEGEQSGT